MNWLVIKNKYQPVSFIFSFTSNYRLKNLKILIFMKTKNPCNCNSENKIVLACSGASDIGHLSDLASRNLRDSGLCKMSCLALAGAGIEDFLNTFRKSDLLVIDGCSLDCGKTIMNKNGINNYRHLRLTDLGYKKGETTITEEIIQHVAKEAEKSFQLI